MNVADEFITEDLFDEELKVCGNVADSHHMPDAPALDWRPDYLVSAQAPPVPEGSLHTATKVR